MALSARSMFLYGYQVTESNSSIDFRSVSGGPILFATLRLGYYSLTGLMIEIKRAMELSDPAFTYTITADRTISGGTQNRVTIATNSTYLDLLFGTGPRVASALAPLIGFIFSNRTGGTSYQGTLTSGKTLTTTKAGYNYIDPKRKQHVFGSVNVSASGVKEAIAFAIQSFWQVEFKYEPSVKVDNEWLDLNQWLMLQRPVEFTKEITSPSVILEGTLERSPEDGKGLGFYMKEQLPNFPNLYETGSLLFRLTNRD